MLCSKNGAHLGYPNGLSAVECQPCRPSAQPERHWLDDSSDSDDEIPRERMAALKTDLRAIRPALIGM
jgi:hypothetical protein